ncbi:MAG: HEPN domain-containing protein [Spirochaetota bacterium]
MPHSDTTAEYWFALARDDEKSARILLRESAAPDIIAYHFHQAIEKALKGGIARTGHDIPRTHDLERLFKTAQSYGANLDEGLFDAIALIHSYYSDLRYPRGDRLTSADAARIAAAFGEIAIDGLNVE